FSLWTTYNLTPKLTIGGGAFYVDQVYGDVGNTVYVPSYTRYDAMASYTPDYGDMPQHDFVPAQQEQAWKPNKGGGKKQWSDKPWDKNRKGGKAWQQRDEAPPRVPAPVEPPTLAA
ncbi:hypothetical protein SB912_24925, partial [Pantoea sp. SIMBA_072]